MMMINRKKSDKSLAIEHVILYHRKPSILRHSVTKIYKTELHFLIIMTHKLSI